VISKALYVSNAAIVSKVTQYLTLNFGLQPTGFAKDAWNVLKFISAYAARKKLEINGAIAFSSPAT
jgi:hypothetical protein